MININLDRKYKFPKDLTPVKCNGYLLLISPSNGNWIVLDNQKQADIVKELMSFKSVGELFKDSNYLQSDIESVIYEIEGRHFCDNYARIDDNFTLRIYLTNRCNLRCKHCFMYSAKSLKNELTYEEIIELLDKSSDAGCKKVIFSGGEVLLKSRFMEIMSYAHKLGMYVQVLTNGTLWDDNKIKIASNFIDEVQVSIDGFNEDTNAEIRGKGVFSRSIMTVEKFIATKKVFVSICMSPLYEYISKYKDEYIRFSREMVKRFENENFLIIFNREIFDGRFVKSNSQENKIISSIVDEIYDAIYPNAKLTTFVLNHANNRIYESCGYGGLTVNSNGDIYFCGRINEVMCYGNLRELDYEKIFKLRKKVRERSLVYNISPCNKCDIKLVCGGGCRVSFLSSMTKTNIASNEKPIIFTRRCTKEYKDKIYKLMIDSSKYLYF